jgi:hypothetical protein
LIVVTIIQKEKPHEDIEDTKNTSRIMMNDRQANESDTNEVIKETTTKKKSLKTKLKNKLKSLKPNKIENEKQSKGSKAKTNAKSDVSLKQSAQTTPVPPASTPALVIKTPEDATSVQPNSNSVSFLVSNPVIHETNNSSEINN